MSVIDTVMAVGRTAQLTAVACDASNNVVAVTFNYTSTATSTATVNPVNGLVSALAAGTTRSRLLRTATPWSARSRYARSMPICGCDVRARRADAAADCLDAAHVKFSWAEGGTVADGSVTTAKLADGAVTSAKIADGTIVAADVLATSVQVRVTGTCAVGSYVRAIASNGTVTCESAPSILALDQVLQQWSVPASSSNNLLTADRPFGKTLLSGGGELWIEPRAHGLPCGGWYWRDLPTAEAVARAAQQPDRRRDSGQRSRHLCVRQLSA